MECASDREIWSDNEKSDGSFHEINNGVIEHTEARIVVEISQGFRLSERTVLARNESE